MNAEKKAKQDQVKEIFQKLTSSKSMVVAEYVGLTVKNLQSLRKQLKMSGVELKVYKNRLFKLAAKEAGFESINSSLIGQNIYAFGMEDEISPAKVIAEFAKTIQALKMKIGTYEGKVIDANQLDIISKLPSLPEALTILAKSMINPLQNISIGLKMIVDEDKLEASTQEKS